MRFKFTNNRLIIVNSVSDSVLNKQRVNLLVDGLDTIANIYLNDEMIGKTDNQFRRYVFDVKSKLKAKQNSIRVDIESARNYTLTQFKWFHDKFKYDIQGDKE